MMNTLSRGRVEGEGRRRRRRAARLAIGAALVLGLLLGAILTVDALNGSAVAEPEPALEGRAVVYAGASPLWRIERVESGMVGLYSSLVLDSAGRPHISYYDYGEDDLMYAYRGDSGWVTETVDYAGYYGAYTSLALDSADRPHISYCECTNDTCATCEDLRYAWHDGSIWHVEEAHTAGTDNVGGHTSIALVADRPHISYYDFTHSALRYVYKDSGGTPHWAMLDNSADVGQYTSLAIASGYRYISYFDDTANELKYAYYNGSSWTTQTLDSTTDTGYFSSLALCTTYVPAAPRIAYWSNGDLKYAHKWFFGGWTFLTVNNDSPGGVSLALDVNCQQHISYYDLLTGDLKYTYNDSGWHVETVDDDGDVWPYQSSLVLDSYGMPRISYYDDSHFGLSYAYKCHGTFLPLVLRGYP
jgi:hypothetical protein